MRATQVAICLGCVAASTSAMVSARGATAGAGVETIVSVPSRFELAAVPFGRDPETTERGARELALTNGASLASTSAAVEGRASGDFSSIAKRTSSMPPGSVDRTSSGSSGACAVHCMLSSSRGEALRNGGAPARHS